MFLQCVEALLNPLKLNAPVETKTMTDKFAAVCILQVHTPSATLTSYSSQLVHAFS
jgi:hypothetical protein